MHKDATERDIQKGAYVAYAVTTGSRAGLKFGAVVKLKEKATTVNRWDQQNQTYVPEPHIEYKIQIISAEYAYIYNAPPGSPSFKWQIQGKKKGKLAKVQTLDRLDRVIVLHPDQVHPEAKKLLDKELHERGQL